MEPLPHTKPVEPDCLLVNPTAGGGRARQFLPGLRDFAKANAWNVEIVSTVSSEDFAAKARHAASAGHTRIFALGGDGTFQILLNSVSAFPDIILGLLPAGGGNDLALSLGLPDDPVRAAELLLRGTACPVDAVCVCTSEGKQRLYCGGGGVGLDAEAARYAATAFRNFPGRLRYLASAVRALLSFRAAEARITIHTPDGRELSLRALVVAVLNTPSYGAGLRLAPGALIDDGLLDLVVLEDLHFMEVMTLLPSLWRSGELKTSRVRRFSVQRLRMETDTPRPFHGDGEILGSTPVEIAVVPRAVRVLRPSSIR